MRKRNSTGQFLPQDKINIQCKNCESVFSAFPHQIIRKFCSNRCVGEFHKLHPHKTSNGHYFKHSQESKIKMSLASKGKPKSEEHRISMSKSRKGIYAEEKNPAWKGDSVGYVALHSWVNRRLGKPTKCENCGVDELNGHKIHWANKDHKYKRNLSDWIRLCVSCHWKQQAENIENSRYKNTFSICR